MDRQQLVDQITAIDLQISRIRDSAKSLEREMTARDAGPVSEQDRQRSARYVDEVRSLVDRKRALRIQISEI